MQLQQPLLNTLAIDELPLTAVTSDPAANGLHLNQDIYNAVENNRHADFALLLAMFSNDVRQTAPIDPLDLESELTQTATTDQALRQQFGVAKPQQLQADADSYHKGAQVSHLFHSAGIQSAKLGESLSPDALGYMPEKTSGLGEKVYRNLSLHDKLALDQSESTAPLSTNNLYQQLLVATRTDQLQAQA